MQYTKDSFYMTLLARLVALDPQRTVNLNGVTRPALIVAENELVIPVQPVADAFYIEWGSSEPVNRQEGDRALFAMECVISYHTFGTVESGVNRGRTLASLDTDFISISQPPRTSKRNYAVVPSSDLGTSIWWTTPVLGKVTGSESLNSEGLPRATEGPRLERSATLRVFYFSEVNFS
jgi:hypothetical protein